VVRDGTKRGLKDPRKNPKIELYLSCRIIRGKPPLNQIFLL